MKKFSKLLLYVIDLESAIAKKLVNETSEGDPNMIATNAAHDVLTQVLEYGRILMKEEMPNFEPEEKKEHKVKLHLVS